MCILSYYHIIILSYHNTIISYILSYYHIISYRTINIIQSYCVIVNRIISFIHSIIHYHTIILSTRYAIVWRRVANLSTGNSYRKKVTARTRLWPLGNKEVTRASDPEHHRKKKGHEKNPPTVACRPKQHALPVYHLDITHNNGSPGSRCDREDTGMKLFYWVPFPRRSPGDHARPRPASLGIFRFRVVYIVK